MPLFLVRRTKPFDSAVDFDAAMFRALVCTQAFPGLKWIRSYTTEAVQTSYCVYEANSADDIRAYSRMASIPYDEILEVGELTREAYWTPALNDGRPPALAS